MIVSDFQFEKAIGNTLHNKKFVATVEVTTGVLFWKKTVRRKVMREYCGVWFFVDNGEFTPGFQVEKLARSWSANTGIET